MDVAKAVQRFSGDAEALAHSNLSADRPAFTFPFWGAGIGHLVANGVPSSPNTCGASIGRITVNGQAFPK